jgi:hypothetical protein
VIASWHRSLREGLSDCNHYEFIFSHSYREYRPSIRAIFLSIATKCDYPNVDILTTKAAKIRLSCLLINGLLQGVHCSIDFGFCVVSRVKTGTAVASQGDL